MAKKTEDNEKEFDRLLKVGFDLYAKEKLAEIPDMKNEPGNYTLYGKCIEKIRKPKPVLAGIMLSACLCSLLLAVFIFAKVVSSDSPVTPPASADTTGDVAGYYASIGIRYEASYNGLKEMIAYVNAFQDRTTITQFTAAFDDATGKLTGEMTLNMYYITNTGKEYVPPVFDFMPKGVSNIFGKTIERSQEALGDPY